MWILSKHLKKSGLSHAQLESLVSQRTIALQNLSSGSSRCRTRRDGE